VTGIPPELEELVARLLSKEPQARAPNALVLSRQLGSMEHGLSIVRQKPAENGGSGEGGVTLSSERTVSAHDEPINPRAVTREAEPFSLASYDPNAPTLVAPDPMVAAIASPMATPAAPQPVREVASSSPAVLPKSDRTAADKPFHSSAPAPADVSVAPPTIDPKATIVQSRFTTVEEDERRREEMQRDSEGSPAAIQIALLALSLAMIAGLLWYLTRPPSAQALFARIDAAASNDTDPNALRNAEDDVQSFLERFPHDEHAAAVKNYQDEINLQKLQSRFQLRARDLAHDDSLAPAELDYMEAMNYLSLDPERAINRLQAVVDLYGSAGDPSERTTECVELARRELQQLRLQAAKTVPQYLALINSNLRKAEQLRASAPEQAQAIWRSIVTLYGDKPWATEQVAKAKAALAASDQAETADGRK
jgi:serine/threonine-protein kinase